MADLFATGTAGILSSWELNRLAAALQGTYGWSVQSGAVTFSSGYIFNVAATAIGDNTVNGVVSTAAYAGGTVTLTNADPTNPRVDVVVITSGGAVSVLAGTPAALTTTAGPVPPTPSAAQLEIARIFVPANNTPAMSATSITDKRATLASSQSPFSLAASNAAATSTTSTSEVDLLTLTVSIAPAKAVIIAGNMRKQALAAQTVGLGLKLNATIVDAATNNQLLIASDNANQAEDGSFEIHIAPRSSAAYATGLFGISVWHVTASGASAVAATLKAGPLTAAMPTVTFTSVIIRGINNVASNALEVFAVSVLAY